MRTLLRRDRGPRRCPPMAGDSGMTLFEVVFAIVLFSIVLTSFAAVVFNALNSMRTTRNQQAVTQFASQAFEAIRALPYDTLSAGLAVDDARTDPAITWIGPDAYLDDYRVLTSSATPNGSALNPHVRVGGPANPDLVVNGVAYTVAAYPVFCYQPKSDPTACKPARNLGSDSMLIRLVVDVRWTDRGAPRTWRTSSYVFSPDGCQPNISHTFSGPCEPFFYAYADISAGLLSARPAVDYPDARSTAFQNVEVSFAATSARILQEQTASVVGSTIGSLAQVQTGTQAYPSGGEAARAVATTDPGAVNGLAQSGSYYQTYAQPLFLPVAYNQPGPTPAQPRTGDSGDGDSGIGVIPGRDQGTTVATAAAGATGETCPDPAGDHEPTGQACVSSTTLSGGGTLRIGLGGSAVLTAATVDPAAAASRAWAARYVKDSSTLYCRDADDVGCVEATVARTLGQVTLAALPPALDDAMGEKWRGYLLRVSPYSDVLLAGQGQSARDPKVRVLGTPTVEYWTGNGYATLPLASTGMLGRRIDVAPVTVSGGGLTVRVEPDLFVGDRTVVSSGDSGCLVACTSILTAESPVTGTIEVYATRDGIPVAAYAVAINLGNATVHATYQAVPS